MGQESDKIAGLIRELKNQDRSGRAEAAQALSEIGAPAVEPLCAALRDASAEVLAAETLGRIGDALREASLEVCSLTVATLGRIGDARAVPALCAALQDEHGAVACSAAIALGEIGDPRAVGPLCEVLQQSSPALRYHVAETLGQIGDPRAVLPLYGARKEMNAAVRARMAEALGRIVLREPAAEVLVQLGGAAVLPLCEVLKDKNAEARCQAARMLTRIAAREPAPELRAALAPLHQLLTPWRAWREWIYEDEEQTYRAAIEKIEAATAALDLPLPAAAPARSSDGLPIPAPPPSLDVEQLPVPAAAPSPDAGSLPFPTASHDTPGNSIGGQSISLLTRQTSLHACWQSLAGVLRRLQRQRNHP